MKTAPWMEKAMTDAYEQFRKLIKIGKFKEAAEQAEYQYLHGPPENPFWLTQQAGALNRVAEHQAAYDLALQALRVDSANPYGVMVAADSLLGLGRVAEALRHYEEILQHPRISQRAWRGYLECLVRLKKWPEVLQGIARGEISEQAGIPFRIKALVGLKKRQEALAACRRWLELQPHYPPALWELTELELQRDGPEQVLSRLGKLARIPSLPAIYKEIYASLCRRTGKPELAIRQYQQIESQGSQPRIQRKQAFLLAKTGQEREAIPLLEELLRQAPKDMYLHSSYGAACVRIGELERGINFYNQLLGLYPQEKSLYGRLNRLRRRLEADSDDRIGGQTPEGADK